MDKGLPLGILSHNIWGERIESSLILKETKVEKENIFNWLGKEEKCLQISTRGYLIGAK